MRSLINSLNSLFLGVILGMIFVAIIHSCPSHWQENFRTGGIAIGYEQIRALRK